MKKLISLLLVGILSVISFIAGVSAFSDDKILQNNDVNASILGESKILANDVWVYEYETRSVWKIAQQLFKIANKLRDPKIQKQIWETLQKYADELAEKVDDVAEAIGNGWRSVMLHLQDALWRISAAPSEMRKIWDEIIDFFF